MNELVEFNGGNENHNEKIHHNISFIGAFVKLHVNRRRDPETGRKNRNRIAPIRYSDHHPINIHTVTTDRHAVITYGHTAP